MIISAEILEDIEKLDPSTRGIFIKLFREIEKAIGEVVTRKDFIELREEIKALTKAVQELAEAQRQTEERIKELAEAQKLTEANLSKLVEEHKKTREQLGGFSHKVGYILEYRAY